MSNEKQKNQEQIVSPMFIKQYELLRDEIKNRQRRRFQILMSSILGIPAVGNLGVQFDLGILTLGLPPLIIIAALLFVSEINGAMRVGEFIREKLEPIMQNNGVPGWETWLENSAERRLVEKYVIWAFFALMSLYFVFSIVFAAIYDMKMIYPWVKYLLIVIYIIGGVIVGSKIYKESRITTKSKD